MNSRPGIAPPSLNSGCLNIHGSSRRPQAGDYYESVRAIIEGRTVSSPARGGSIGSESCRQILLHGRAALIMLECSECSCSSSNRKSRTHPSLNGASLVLVIADIFWLKRVQYLSRLPAARRFRRCRAQARAFNGASARRGYHVHFFYDDSAPR